MKNKFLLVIAFLSVVFTGYIFGSNAISIKIKNQRHAFYRNEVVTFTADVVNATKLNFEQIKIKMAIHPVNPYITKLADYSGYEYAQETLSPLPLVEKTVSLKKDKIKSVEYKLNCSLLKEGEYYLEVTTDNENNITKSKHSIYISQQPNPQRFPVYLWGNNAHLMDWGIKHGFNEVQIGDIEWPLTESDSTVSIYCRILEDGIRKKVDVGMYFYTFNPKRYKDHPEVNATHRKSMGKQQVDGMWTEDICLREPYVMEYSRNITKAAMNLFSKYPSLNDVLINSEYIAIPCFSDNCTNLMKKETGLDLYDYDLNPLLPPQTAEEVSELGLPNKFLKTIPSRGIIEDDNPFYKYYMWWWKKGLGDVPLNKHIADIIEESKPEVMTWNDPLRLAPVYGRKEGLEGISTWIYTHPDPKYMGYVELMITAAKPENKKIIPSITLWEYENWLAPTDSGTVVIPPDIFKENNWIALSRRPDMLLNYIPGPMLPTIDIDPFHRDVKTFEAMTWMSENVYKPYGAFIKQMKRSSRKVAMLISASSLLYPEFERGEFPNKSIFPFYSLLMMSHIPTDIVYDETIAAGGLEQYDILFLSQTETLTRSVYEEILKFKRRGGEVIGDNILRADIPLDYKIEFNLDHRKKQLADLILMGKGVTADEDKELMTKYSKEIRKMVDGKLKRYVDSPSSEVVFNVLENGVAKYIFMVNDKRTYGERFGKWKTMHTKGVEQVVDAKIKYDGSSVPTLYDVRTHSIIPTSNENGYLKFSRKLEPADATIIAVYPNPISEINIDLPKIVKRGETATINISINDSRGKSYGTQPMYVRITATGDTDTPYTSYYATNDGKCSIDIIPAINNLAGTWRVEVTDLTSNIKSFKEFKVK